MSYLNPASMEQFARAYPLAPTMLHHSLAGHPLLDLPALAQAAQELPAHHVERRVANAVNGGDFAIDGSDGLDPAEVIHAVETSGNWIMLRFVEQLPRYRALLRELITELDPATAPRTGKSLAPKGFIFISAPGTLTPFHFDAEFNVLFQIAGPKQFATYPPVPPFLTLERHEAYHRSGENLLPWHEDFEHAATLHDLTPGDALYVPYGAPHWVRAGDEPSVSLSLTWQNGWSMAASDALAINPALRRLRLPAADLPSWPKAPRWRALARRAARRLGIWH